MRDWRDGVEAELRNGGAEDGAEEVTGKEPMTSAGKLRGKKSKMGDDINDVVIVEDMLTCRLLKHKELLLASSCGLPIRTGTKGNPAFAQEAQDVTK